MKNLTLVISIACLAVATSAQSTTVCPSGFANKEGGHFASRFGVYSDMRLQWADGECSGMRTVKGFGMRADVSGAPWIFNGRKFKNLTIHASDGNHATMGATFATNILSTPTRVFSGTVHLPSLPKQTSSPANWHSNFHFSFSTTFMRPSGKDLLLDMKMVGGVMDNKAGWGRGRHDYFFDTANIGFARGLVTNYGNGGLTGGCIDSRSKTTRGAYTWLFLEHYGSAHPTTAWRNRTRVFTSGGYYPVNTPILTVMALKENVTGFSFPGVTCNKVHVDLTGPYELFLGNSYATGTTWANRNLFLLGSANATTPYNAAWVGASFVVQNAWTDTGNGSMKLSSAAKTVYPVMPPATWKRNSTYMNNSTSTSGVNSPGMPILRYDN